MHGREVLPVRCETEQIEKCVVIDLRVCPAERGREKSVDPFYVKGAALAVSPTGVLTSVDV